MPCPTLPVPSVRRDTVDQFRGYRRDLTLGSGEFYDMENLTSDHYPLLSPRLPRGEAGDYESPQGLLSKDALCVIDGGDFWMNGYRVPLGLTPGPKTMTSMGAYVIILPDRVWINTLDLTDFGSLDAAFTTQGEATLTLCTADGTPCENITLGDAPPQEPENLQLWMDTSLRPHVLKSYAAATGLWTTPATYVKIHAPGLGEAFCQYDGVNISGCREERLNGSQVIWARDRDFLLISGVIDAPLTQTEPITVQRRMPEVDFLVESGNRLWGCRYGLSAQGAVVNEIYASKLGDFKNWNCYMGLSTDSYAASCGTDGPFTGAVNYLGHPLFFKEGCLHKVYGQYPANFQIQTTALRGVQRGCGRSLAMVGQILYYKSPDGVCAYDGALPELISQALGTDPYDRAAAGAVGEKYCISMRNTARDTWDLFLWDSRRGLWHREDSLQADAFCTHGQVLYALSGGKLLTLAGAPGKEPVRWMAQTGDLGVRSPDAGYLSRVTVRLRLEEGSWVRFLVRYDDSPHWEQLGQIRSARQDSFSLPLRLRRCHRMSLRLEGQGPALIYSITRTLEGGSQKP